MATQKSLTGLNLITDSKDLSQVSWTKESNVTATFNQTGLGGSPNDATLLNGTSSSSVRTYQSVTVTPETWLTVRAFMGQPGSTITGQRVELTPSGGGVTTFNIGKANTRASTLPLATYTAGSVVTWDSPSSGWIEFVCSILVPAGSTTVQIALYPHVAGVTRSSAPSTGSTTVGNVEAYDNTEMWEVINQTPVYT